jgi:hypothetical protein
LATLCLVFVMLVLGCTAQKAPAASCSDYSAEDCPSSCVVCPPCEVCSSISCQTEEFCKGIGFDRSWYEGMKPNLAAS